MKISIIGTGYIGLITGLALTKKGNFVTCLDIDQAKIDALNKGELFFYEPRLKNLLKQALQRKLLRVSRMNYEDITNSNMTIIAVGTPELNYDIDLRYIKNAAKSIGEALKRKKRYHVVVVKSTVTPGTTEQVIGKTVAYFSGKQIGEFGLCMNPEFLREGSAISDAFYPDRIVVGAYDKKSSQKYISLFRSAKCPIIGTNLKTAEMIKYTSNALFATMISFSNEIARICEKLNGVDCEDVWNAIHLDQRLTPLGYQIKTKRLSKITPGFLQYLRSGCGYGGSCLPKDTKALNSFAKSLKLDTPILRSVIRTNNTQPQQIILLAKNALGGLHGKRVALLGLAFKPNTDDIRESPGIKIAKLLLKEQALVICHDPKVTEKNIKNNHPELTIQLFPDINQVLKNANIIIITTSWDEYRKITPHQLKKLTCTPIIIDGRRILSRKNFIRAKIPYFAIGLGN